ncbi:MAG: endonuclease/exonuclease/phosphatase family protein [Firmicutes bacterium]|nr:endonuclease/exonuclease/phosphatase family protein [Bacillota bacterium]
MVIATWNVEGLKHKNKLERMLQVIDNINADILVLTETDRRLRPNYHNVIESKPLFGRMVSIYKATENMVSIYTDYPCIQVYPTYDDYSSVCAELLTEHGNLIVYGMVTGAFGNRGESFNSDLERQMEDISNFSSLRDGICVLGDFNCSFSDNYYFTKKGREAFLRSFDQSDICLLTEGQPECVDHIGVSKNYMLGACCQIDEWNHDKALSDHKGIRANIIWK